MVREGLLGEAALLLKPKITFELGKVQGSKSGLGMLPSEDMVNAKAVYLSDMGGMFFTCRKRFKVKLSLSESFILALLQRYPAIILMKRLNFIIKLATKFKKT